MKKVFALNINGSKVDITNEFWASFNALNLSMNELCEEIKREYCVTKILFN